MHVPIDLLIEARWIIPVEPADVVLEDHAVAVNDGRIVAILQQGEANTRFFPRQRKRLAHHILIPGLVNLHTHAAMTLLRGLADDLPLMEWLQNHIWPAEEKHVSEQFVYDGTLIACAEMLRGGITCFNDMYFYPKAIAGAALASGMRAAIGLITLDLTTPYAADADDYLAKGLAARDPLRDEDKTELEKKRKQTLQEIEDSVQRFGIRPIERLHQLGLLGPGLIGAHGIHLNMDEIALLAQHSCSIAHCPSSNLKLASGIAPTATLVKQGVNMGLGTDGAASNNRLDLFQELRLAALLAKGYSGQADAVGAHQALRMATLGGAQALGLNDAIGSIKIGKAADLCAVNINDIGLTPCYDPASLLVYSAGREYVTDVWVAGQLRVANGHLLETNEIELINLAALWQNQIRPLNV